MDAIINVIAKQLGAVCLPRPLVRKRSGLVGCQVVWELPKPGTAPMSTPTTCSLPYLKPVEGGRAPMNDRGGINCQVDQLAVTDTTNKNGPDGAGWFYDNFTSELMKQCNKAQLQRVAFSKDAKPPTGVVVKLECLNETQRLANTRTDLALGKLQPEIGTPCGKDIMNPDVPSGDTACIVTLADGNQESNLFCHPDLNVCVRKCESSVDCPPAWVCDDRPETVAKTMSHGPYCVNPTCGAD
jgi:hypothetical protein